MRRWIILISLALVSGAPIAFAYDACSPLAIETRANVAVSDGSVFRTETRFHAAEGSAFTQRTGDGETLIVVEGPFSWTRADDTVSAGTEFHKLFALGHQFHAFLLHFEAIAENVEETGEVGFLGDLRAARSGDYPYGGRVHLVSGDSENRPLGLLFEFPDIPAISVVFDDWRDHAGTDLPFALEIDDGTRQFTYAYTDIAIENRSPLWFMRAVGAVDLDAVNVYRLHRQLLAAHCLGDADMMADLSAEEVHSANRGRLGTSDRETTRTRFADVFEAVDYAEYHDLKDPVIRVSDSGALAWIGVEVQAKGSATEDGAPFDMQWAWIMVAEKADGTWRHTANASNMVPTPTE